MHSPRTGAEYLRLKKRRKRNAAQMRRLRDRRDAEGRCRTCKNPVAISEKTGRPAKLCAGHLAADWNRKLPYILPWETNDPLRKSLEQRLEYPLGDLP